MSQSGSLRTGSGGGGSGIETISGDTGSITGTNVTIFTNQAILNSGSSIRFDNSGTVSTLSVTDQLNNTVIGNNSGSANLSSQGGNCTSFGAFNLVEASGSTTESSAFGVAVLASSTTGASQNCGFGNGSLNSLTTGIGNTALGYSTANLLLTGQNNIFLGVMSGTAYTSSESNNILIYNSGVIGDDRTMRLGVTSGAISLLRNFQGGISGVTVSASSPVAVSSTGQLSDLGFGASTQVLTSNGAGVSPTWQANGSGTLNTLTGNSGVATAAAGNINVQGTAGATNISNSPVSTTGLSNNLRVNWNNVLPPTISSGGTVNLTFADYGVIVASPGGGTINLPQTGSTGIFNGKMFFVNDLGHASTNNITINAFAGDNIDGASSLILNNNYQSVTLMYGTNNTWSVMNSTTSTFSPVNFQAYLTSSQTIAAGSTAQTIVFDTTISNVGAGYNTATGIFTAPSTGFYCFSATVFYHNLNLLAANTQIILAYTGNAQSLRLVNSGIGGYSGASDQICNATWSMPMNAGDTVKMQPFADGTGNYQIFGDNATSAAFNTSSTFSGFRVS